MGAAFTDAPAARQGVDDPQTEATTLVCDLSHLDFTPAVVLNLARDRTILGYRDLDLDYFARSIPQRVRHELADDQLQVD